MATRCLASWRPAAALFVILLSSDVLALSVGSSSASAHSKGELRSLRTASHGKSTDEKALGPDPRESSFIRSMEYKHILRVCNAYPSDAAFDVYLNGPKERLTSSSMRYKTCQEFPAQMKNGDRLQFAIGKTDAGAFTVSDLPNNDAILMLVIFRHDTSSSAVSFESHVFANLANAQIAVLDTYKGKAKASFRIEDHQKADTSRSEELRFESVVAVNQGIYEIAALNEAGSAKARKEIVALNRESYVVLRTGVEGTHGDAFPEDIVVFPQSDAHALTGAANTMRSSTLAVAASVLATLVAMMMHA